VIRKLWSDSHAVPSTTVRAQVVVMEDVDDDDVRVYLVMHDENGWVARMQAQHYAEVMAQEEGGTYEH
jgi:hypothetical protein